MSRAALPRFSPYRLPKLAAGALATAMAAWVVVFSFTTLLPQRQHANIVLGAGLAVFYFLRATSLIAEADGDRLTRLNAALAVGLGLLSLGVAAYVHASYFRWLEQGRLLIYTDMDLLVGLLVIYLVIDATFRNYGTVLGLVIVGSIVYGLVGPHLPGLFGHAGMSAEEIVRRQTITLTGIYGFLLQVGATWIAIFVIFAGSVEAYGGFEYLIEVGDRVKERSKSGVAQTAVITSMFMGTMMGAAASNVATTGSFTIPLMEEHGIPPRFAAAFESVASTGGQILPPIMGTAAFLMADILGIPFADIAIAGVIPALIFYLATALGIHYTVVGRGWYGEHSAQSESEPLEDGTPLEPDETPSELADVSAETEGERDSFPVFLARGLQYIVPLVVLIYVLMVLKFGPLTAGLYTIGAATVSRGVRQGLRGNFVEFLRETVQGLHRGGENLAPFLVILGSLGIVINIFSVTGLAQRIAFEMLDIAGGSLVIVLIIAMLVSLLLGLGMPTPAAYVLVATILAPVLVRAGLAEITAHFYIFYFALLSSITPPVALAVTVAISISGTDFVETAKETLILGGPVYVIPFMFVFGPELLVWSFPSTAVTAAFFGLSAFALVLALTGFVGIQRLTLSRRATFAGFFLLVGFSPSVLLKAAAAVLFLALAAYSAEVTVSDLAQVRPS